MTRPHRKMQLWACRIWGAQIWSAQDSGAQAFSASVRRAAISGVLGLALLGAAAPGVARAQDADSDDNSTTIWNFDKKFMDTMMHGLGLENGSESTIEYHERSPLVVPPTRALPPPQSSTAALAPNWPVDPDAKRHQATKAKHQSGNPEVDWDNFVGNGSPAQDAKMRGGASPQGQVPSGDGANTMESSLKPSGLGYNGGLFSSLFKGTSSGDEVGTFTGERPRTSLIEPPPGYQTPSPSQPYGLAKKTEYGKAKKAEDIPVGDAGP